ncbi:MAG: stage II sporulation protein D [Oscillospiraceae bacterium]
MKPVIILSLIALILALALPLVLGAASGSAEALPSAAPSVGVSDSALTFTVLSGGETKTVSMAEWLPGVVAGEMPALFEEEALKAQAVAARTYIISRKRLGTSAHPEADVCDNPDCCKAHTSSENLRLKWGDNYESCMQKINAAVSATDGEYLSYGGEAIQALFHSSSPGRTEDSGALWAALPYLVSVDSPETAEDVPNFVTEVAVSVTDFASTLRAAGYSPDLSATPDKWVGKLEEDGGGRVAVAPIGGTEFTGAELRRIFALRSAAFTLEYINGEFLFTVTGFGHGVGMSQYGANVMAKNGADYAEILARYYPGTALEG